MDNTLKLIFGVLGVSGLLVLLVPQGDPIDGKSAEKSATIKSPVAQELPETTSENAGEEEVGEEHELEFKLGDPMMDGMPIEPVAGDEGNDSNAGNPSRPDITYSAPAQSTGSNNNVAEAASANIAGGLPPPAPLPPGMMPGQ